MRAAGPLLTQDDVVVFRGGNAGRVCSPCRKAAEKAATFRNGSSVEIQSGVNSGAQPGQLRAVLAPFECCETDRPRPELSSQSMDATAKAPCGSFLPMRYWKELPSSYPSRTGTCLPSLTWPCRGRISSPRKHKRKRFSWHSKPLGLRLEARCPPV